MANPLTYLFTPISAGLSAAKKGLTGGPVASMALGSTVGAVAGASGGYDSTSMIEGAAKGAVLGAAGGAAFSGIKTATGAGFRGAGRMLKSPTKMYGAAKGAAKAAIGAGKRAGKVGMFALENPLLLAGGAAGAMGVAAFASSRPGAQSLTSPTLEGAAVRANYNEQGMVAAEMGKIGGGTIGSAPEMMNQFQNANWMKQVGSMMADTPGGRMAGSAHGLVQGMHAGRHG